MGLFGKRKAGTGVFGRQVAEVDVPPFTQRGLRLLDGIWEAVDETRRRDYPKSGGGLPYHMWWPSRERQFHVLAIVALDVALEEAQREGHDPSRMVDRDIGLLLLHAYGNPQRLMDQASRRGYVDVEELAALASRYGSEGIEIFMELSKSYGS